MDKKLAKLVEGFKADFEKRRPEMHPEDLENEINGWVEGETYAPDFCREHLEWFVQMIAVYPDGDAHEVLDEIRDRFWSMTRPPAATKVALAGTAGEPGKGTP
jgi:hypothetical protein